MGWCSATSIFDATIDALDEALETSNAEEDQKITIAHAVAKRLAEQLWEGDWDCESDSDHFLRFHDILCYSCARGDEEDCYVRNPE